MGTSRPKHGHPRPKGDTRGLYKNAVQSHLQTRQKQSTEESGISAEWTRLWEVTPVAASGHAGNSGQGRGKVCMSRNWQGVYMMLVKSSREQSAERLGPDSEIL